MNYNNNNNNNNNNLYSDMDLDLNNYTLQDIFHLFQIQSLDYNSLKTCYKTTMKTHPDYSKLDKSIFIFFSKAYTLLKQVHELYLNKNRQLDDCEYDDILDDEQKESIADNVINDTLTKENFNTWFNKTFESINTIDQEQKNGYDTWLHETSKNYSDPDEIKLPKTSITDMHRKINKQKQKLHNSIITIDTPEYINPTQFSILREKIDDYSSDIFSSLPYQDLKKAHTETVIPTTYNNLPSILPKNVQSYQSQRDQDIHNIQYIKEIQNNTQEDIEYTYKLAKQNEMSEKINQKWWSSLKQLSM